VLRVCLLGAPEVFIDHLLIKGWRSKKALGLFNYLAMNPHIHKRSDLANLFWPEQSQEKALTNLRINLHNINQLLPLCLEIDRNTVQLATAFPLQLDTTEFLALLQKDSVESLMSALRLWRGEFMADMDDIGTQDFALWLSTQREIWKHRYFEINDQLIQAHLDNRRVQPAIELAYSLIQIDPLREKSNHLLIESLISNGERLQALQVYDAYSDLLQKELSAEPSDTLTQYVKLIRYASVHQRVKNNLYQELTPFIGYRDESVRLKKLIKDEETHLITVTGIGGSGKTRLALHTAHEELLNSWDGVYFISLLSTREGDLPQTILRSLGLPDTAPNEPMRLLKAWLRRRHVLLFLDDFNLLVNDKLTLVDLLQHAPLLKIVVTCRQRLMIRGEYVLELNGLETPSHGKHPITKTHKQIKNSAHLPLSASEQMFLQTVQRVQHTYQAVGADEISIKILCRLVGGNPLALELAAGRVSESPVSKIVEEVRHKLELISDNEADPNNNQRSIVAILNTTYDALPVASQRMYRQISILTDPFDLDTAAALCGLNREICQSLLTSLVRRSLLRRHEQDKYAWHPLIQQDAKARLYTAISEFEQQRQRYMDYFQDFVANVPLKRFGPRDHQIIGAVDAIYNDFTTAWKWALEQWNLDFLSQTARNLMLHADLGFRYHDAATLLEDAVQQLRKRLKEKTEHNSMTTVTDDGVLRIARLLSHLLLRLARVYLLMNDLDKVERLCNESRTVQQRYQITHANTDPDLDEELRIIDIGLQGIVAMNRGQFDSCFHAMQELIKAGTRSNEQGIVAVALGHLADIAAYTGDLPQAVAYLEQCRAIFEQLEDHSSTAVVLINLSDAYYYLRQDATVALSMVEKAAQLYSMEKDQVGHAYALFKKAWLLLDNFSPPSADWFDMVQTSLQIRRDLDDRLAIASTLQLLAFGQIQTGDLLEAEDNLYEALQISVDQTLLPQQVNCIGLYGLWAAQNGDRHTSLELIQFALYRSECEPHIRHLLTMAVDPLAAQFSLEENAAILAAAHQRQIAEIVNDLFMGILLE
jgi:DNA-binding SARP family transcriptional activator/predicted ATPase